MHMCSEYFMVSLLERFVFCGVSVFFFSSRRRHTRCGRDWSSDVCSSDLYGAGSGRYAATTNGPGRRAVEVCSNQAPELTDWPIERISEGVQPTDAQRPALDELKAASVKAIEMLQSACPKDLPSIPTGRLAAMESRLQVMLAAVQTVRPALERFYQS